MSAPLLDMTLLIDLGMIFVLATVLSYIARIFKQPSLIAYIAAGMILGPIGLGAMGITIGGVPIGVSAIGNDIKILSELGIAFLLFSVGVESNFSKLKDLGRVVLAGGILQVVITALAVFLLSMHFQLVGFAEAVYIGLIVAFSSTIIVVKLLSDSHTINTLHGRILIGILLVQDMLVILAMPLLANLDQVLSMQAFFPVLAQGVFIIALAYLLNKYAYPRIFNFATQSDDLFYHVAISSCFIFIGIAYVLNFSIAIGAFIAGLSISTLPYNLEVYNRVRGVRDLFATVFFVTLGMQITLSFAAIPLGLILVVLGAVFFLKPLILYLITLFSGFGGRVSLMVALGLAQVSEFSFILLSQGEQANVFQTPGLYSFLLLVIAASMVITPYSMQYSTRIYSLFNRLFSGYAQPFKHKALYRRIHKMESVPKGLNNHIIIVGGGTMGYSVAAALKDTHDLVVLDHDSERVFKCMGRG
ncbi:cation:proton antiporter, partial [Candidatus Micrarchaeota archaeon]|nr:cation:proton antiporter [Candidatus Micrarchaeota archaeon]